MKALGYIQKFMGMCAGLFLVCIVVVVLLQVVARALPEVTLTWTEEASRFIMVFMANIAGVAAMSASSFIRVDFLLDAVPKKVAIALEILGDVLVCAFLVLLLAPSFEIVMLRMAQSSPSLGLPMGVPQGAVFLGVLGTLLAGIVKILSRLLGQGDTTNA